MFLMSKVVLQIESSAGRTWLPDSVQMVLEDLALPRGADRYEAPTDERGSHRMEFDLVCGGADGLLERFEELIDALEGESIPWEVLEYRDGAPFCGQRWVPGLRGSVEFFVIDPDGTRALSERDLLSRLQRTPDERAFGVAVLEALEVLVSDERALDRAQRSRGVSW